MKDYKEIAAEVFARRDEYLIKQKKRRKTIAAVASVCAALCVAVGVGVGIWNKYKVTDPTSLPYKDKVVVAPPVTEFPEKGNPIVGTPDAPDDIPNKGSINFGSLVTGTPLGESAAVKGSDVVVYAQIESFESVGDGILCTLSVIDMLKGEDADQISFVFRIEDNVRYEALAQCDKGVFFLKKGEKELRLTNGGSSIFYEVDDDDFRAYDETGLIGYYLTMKEIVDLTEAGL